MIRVFDLPAVTWTLTTVLLLSGSYYLVQATRSHQLTDRVNNSLHALMNILMASMLWSLGASTILAQIVVLTGAALWFFLQAVARPELKALCTDRQGRIKCIYHSFTMVGAAIMVAMMMGHDTAGQSPLPAGAVAISHHAMPVPTAAAATLGPSPDLAIFLTPFFGVAAVVFLVLLLRFQVAKAIPRSTALRSAARAEHGVEALGAAVMTLMLASMS
ncbi:DUF5134 domain-containing protein [Cryobacterium sp. Y29]|uniref:DUF5134 domain-containing protein n=1 Tax=Cryobacterium sp. Y29 TaxID=2048285 RepID=UPI000CE4378B|nr:DUF5134 domain-containing protein [Cryobacterium sp. Y29]